MEAELRVPQIVLGGKGTYHFQLVVISLSVSQLRRAATQVSSKRHRILRHVEHSPRLL